MSDSGAGTSQSEKNKTLFLCAARGDVESLKEAVREGADLNSLDRVSGTTALTKVAVRGHDKCVEVLIQSGADVNKKGKHDYTALMKTAENGQDKCIELLIQAGADVNKQGLWGFTALMFAASSGHDKCVESLIQAGADVNLQSTQGYTALMLGTKNEKCVELLIQAGANVRKQSEDGRTALIIAAENGYDNCVELFLQEGADVNQQDKKGSTALMVAVQKDHPKCVNLLMKAGAEMKTDEKAEVLVHVAKNGDHDSLELLIQGGADVSKLHEKGWEALMSAAEKGHDKCVSQLIQAGANVNQQDKKGSTALMVAVEKDHPECVNVLMKAGAEMKTDEKARVLMSVAKNGDYESFKLLIDAGADLEEQDEYGRTALMFAAENGHYNCVELLIQIGVDLDKQDKDRWTALMKSIFQNRNKYEDPLLKEENVEAWNRDKRKALIWAAENSHGKCFELLLQAGADVNKEDKDGRIALMYVVQCMSYKGNIAQELNRMRFKTSFFRKLNKKMTKVTKLLQVVGASQVEPVTTKASNFFDLPSELNLKHLCRETIINHLLQINSVNLFKRIPQTGLPSSLVKYLIDVTLGDCDDDDEDERNYVSLISLISRKCIPFLP